MPTLPLRVYCPKAISRNRTGMPMITTKHRNGSRKAPESRRLNGALGHNYVTDPLKKSKRRVSKSVFYAQPLKKKEKKRKKKKEEEGEEGEEEEWTLLKALNKNNVTHIT